MAIPGTNLFVGIGKDKLFRVIDSTNMGHFNSGFDNDVQCNYRCHQRLFRSARLLDSPNNGPVVYLWGPKDFLKAYKYVGPLFQTTPVTKARCKTAAVFPTPFRSRFQQTVTWWVAALSGVQLPFCGVATGPSVPGILRAFDATNLATELWDSKQNAARDDVVCMRSLIRPRWRMEKSIWARFPVNWWFTG